MAIFGSFQPSYFFGSFFPRVDDMAIPFRYATGHYLHLEVIDPEIIVDLTSPR